MLDSTTCLPHESGAIQKSDPTTQQANLSTFFCLVLSFVVNFCPLGLVFEWLVIDESQTDHLRTGL